MGTPEPRIPARGGGQVGDLGQAQLLALVDVGGSGQGEQQQGRGPRAAGAELGARGAQARQPVDGLRPEALVQPVAARRPGYVVVADDPWRARAVGQREDPVDRAAQSGHVPAGHDQLEVEDLGQAAGIEVRHQGVWNVGPDLADRGPRPREPVRRVRLQDGPPEPVELLQLGPVVVGRGRVHRVMKVVGVGVVGQIGVLVDPVRHVHPQARRATVEPEPDHLLEEGGHVRIPPVPIRLADVEQVQVPLAGPAVGLGHTGPGQAAEQRLPVVRRQLAVAAPPVAENEPVPLPAAGRCRQRGLEQRVCARAMIGHQVDDHPYLVRFAVFDQAIEVRHGAEQRIHGAVVADVVSAVGQRGRVEGRQPDGVHAEVSQVGQAGPQPGQITNAVAVRVGKTSRVHLVDDRVFPPRMPVSAHASPFLPPTSPHLMSEPARTVPGGGRRVDAEASGCLVVPPVFKTGGRRAASSAGSIPVRLRDALTHAADHRSVSGSIPFPLSRPEWPSTEEGERQCHRGSFSYCWWSQSALASLAWASGKVRAVRHSDGGLVSCSASSGSSSSRASRRPVRRSWLRHSASIRSRPGTPGTPIRRSSHTRLTRRQVRGRTRLTRRRIRGHTYSSRRLVSGSRRLPPGLVGAAAL